MLFPLEDRVLYQSRTHTRGEPSVIMIRRDDTYNVADLKILSKKVDTPISVNRLVLR